MSPEQISSVELIPEGGVRPSRLDEVKTISALIIAGVALLIGVLFLGVGLYSDDKELRTWATGLISLVVGAAIGFAFSNKS